MHTVIGGIQWLLYALFLLSPLVLALYGMLFVYEMLRMNPDLAFWIAHNFAENESLTPTQPVLRAVSE